MTSLKEDVYVGEGGKSISRRLCGIIDKAEGVHASAEAVDEPDLAQERRFKDWKMRERMQEVEMT